MNAELDQKMLLAGLEMATQASPALVYWLNPAGEMLYISPAGIRITGHALEEFQDNPDLLTELIVAGERELWCNHQHRVDAHGQPRPMEFHLNSASGEKLVISHICQRAQAQDGADLGLIGWNLDMTDLRSIEAQMLTYAQEQEWQNWRLGAAYEELERINKELDDFAYVASHDLREPLRGIRNYSGFLLEDYADRLEEDGRSKLETLIRLSDRLDGLIGSLLEYSRVGRQEMLLQATDLNAVVADVLEAVKITLDEKKVEVRLVSPLPTMNCDPVRIRQAFHNLITNAIKYNDREHKLLEIGCSTEYTDDDNLELWGEGEHRTQKRVFYVADNGIGIREKHLDTVFRLFKRLHGRDQYGGGTGFGLTLVKKIVQRHGGRIWVESKLGEGSTFYFTLEKGE